MPRLSVLSLFHISMTIFSLYLLVKQLIRVISLTSDFPEEILAEIEDMNFDLFNTEHGSYQTIIPAILHIVHTSMVPGLTFVEAAIARSAIKYGGMDSVYIHSVVDLQSRFLDELLTDELVSEQERVTLLQITFKDNSTKFTEDEVLWASLNALEGIGGVAVRPGVLLLNEISSLLKFEAAVHWREGGNYPDMVMAHSAARLMDGTRELPDHHSIGHALTLLNTTQIVKRFPDTGLIAAISEVISLPDILQHNIVDINANQHLHLFDDENIKTSPSLAAALLRKAWFDTTRFIQ